MGTRSTQRWAILGYVFGLGVLLMGLAIQIGDVHGDILAYAVFSIGVVAFFVVIVAWFQWSAEARGGGWLKFGSYSGGMSVEGSNATWNYLIPIVNSPEEYSVGILDIKLRIERGSRRMDILPSNFTKPYLGPNAPKDLVLTFNGESGLGKRIDGDPELETAHLLISDSIGHNYKPIPLGEFSASIYE